MIRVWFNHWFSTSFRIIELMKEDPNQQVYVIGSNQVYHSVISQACDEWYEEPELDGEEYIDFCVEFCKKHSIHVFVPRKEMVEISKHRMRFEEIGTKIMADSYEYMKILNDKAKTYALVKEKTNIPVPEYKVVNSMEQFEEAYKQLSEYNTKLCIKFVHDEGGMSFRVIEQEIPLFSSLSVYPSSRISLDNLRAALREKGQFEDLMIMPYLSGEEISVDCLTTKKGLIAIPRYKGSSRDEKIMYNTEILKMCQEVLELLPLQCPCNIQFKVKDGIPYLLEINTRMSGGVQMSCLGAKVNIPNIALNKLLGSDMDWSYRKEDCIVSYIELPRIIDIA